MSLKRIILAGLTIFAALLIGLSLFESWSQPQIQSRLELYQTNLVLHTAELQDPAQPTNPQPANPNLQVARNTLIGVDPVKTGLEQYQKVRQSAQTQLEKARTALDTLKAQVPKPPTPTDIQPDLAPLIDPGPLAAQMQQLQSSIKQLEPFVQELDLRLGLLQVRQNQVAAARDTWQRLVQPTPNRLTPATETETAKVLLGLWSDPPQLFPDAEETIQQSLEGWFRYTALSQLYQLQQRQASLEKLQAAEQETAQSALVKLTIIGGIPTLGVFLGISLLLFLIGQRLLKGEQSLLALPSSLAWTTPWNGETILQVMVVGFFWMGQLLKLLVPISFALLQINPAKFSERGQAFSTLMLYGLLALATITVLYLSLKRFFPLPTDWFRFNWQGRWIAWGVGGYLVALPLVIGVSLINQRLWDGQGGSNPILPIALEGKDPIALLLFCITASVAAPLFEEFVFRGFLLPSLTRYLPVWGAVVTSGVLFAVVHLSLSEILPLAVLGIVLGFVYVRSRNLLAPMLLHSLWNSGTLLNLFLLGSAGK